jgi:membrane associated rhomboid family serine protease
MNYRPQGFTLLPPIIKNLLIINGLMFMGTIVLKDALGFNFVEMFALYYPGSPNFMPHQLITHMFMHADFGHIFFNMFALWMFGTALENIWGPKKFLIYYMVTGLGAAFIHLGVNYLEMQWMHSQLLEGGFTAADITNLLANGSWSDDVTVSRDIIERYYGNYNFPTLGASGAVFGILLAFGMTFPEQRIYIYFLLPIKAKWFVIIYGAFELWNGVMNTSDGVAHFAHLGGMIFGYFLIKHWQKNQFRQW